MGVASIKFLGCCSDPILSVVPYSVSADPGHHRASSQLDSSVLH